MVTWAGTSHIPFTHPGTLVALDESPPWYPPYEVWIVSARYSTLANTPALSTMDIRVNGTLWYTISLAAGTKTKFDNLKYKRLLLHASNGVSGTPDDYVTCRVNAAGGAADACVELGYIPT